MQPPTVSIVIVSFNQATFLEAAIRSALEQDYPSKQVWLMDGGSSDGSLDIIHRYQDRLAGCVSESDAGQTDAINKGFSRADGDILAWLNSDDVYRPSAVTEAVSFLQAHPDVGMVYGDADYIDEAGRTIGRFPAAATDYRRLRRGYVHIPQQSAFFRARLWRMLGPLDPTFYFAMDYDLWVRIASVSPIRYVPRTWAGFRLHVAAKTLSAADKCWPEMIHVHRRLGGGLLSVIYAKYILRRLFDPVMPLRLRARVGTNHW